MGGTTVFWLTVLMHAAPSISTINPSSSTIDPTHIPISTTNPSSMTSSVTIKPSGTTSDQFSFLSPKAPSISTINPSSSTIVPTTIPISTTNPSSMTSSVTIKPSGTTSDQFGFLSPKPSSSYEVTENVIDIPDDRTLSPDVATNYNLVKPLNKANTTISVDKITKNDTGDESNQLKGISFTYVHFVKDTEKEGGIKKLFRGIKDYIYNIKRGVVDGLHNYFHKDDKKKQNEETNYDKFYRGSGDFSYNNDDDEVQFHHKFHRSYSNDKNLDDYEYDHNHDEFENYFKDLND